MAKKKIIITVIAVVVCLLIVVGLIFILSNRDGVADRKRAQKLLEGAQTEIDTIKEDIPELDKDTYITVDNKVVVGYVEIDSLDIKYPVLNTFNKNTAAHSLCRKGSSMPWDIEGMLIYGIDSFTEVLSELKAGDIMVFEDLAGAKTEYRYIVNNEDDNVNNVIDYGIEICNVDKGGNIKMSYMFEPITGEHNYS